MAAAKHTFPPFVLLLAMLSSAHRCIDSSTDTIWHTVRLTERFNNNFGNLLNLYDENGNEYDLVIHELDMSPLWRHFPIFNADLDALTMALYVILSQSHQVLTA
ncbi:uncharacterized protein BO66DRAFT_435850 [Aspergillus aculeatinus CBS 121060]|uniref:Uncharacterized protein n=1 Tax=Aspergillus aculeatinus CBS 121060 TaxID=1448322 RepID=A0ACD1HHS4_9EURO|nr:hypothetical protein BO66DRAFT_435850 [Aspergillus aculeatinus CBS 121060]RAH72955.1 hypothetical protein BO66DRAFT_435850 [Aspergillus aculeatinus CBS 121060]